MGGALHRSVRFALLCIIPAIAFAQTAPPEGLRDRDPDLAGAKRLASEMQEANFHYGNFYLWSRLRITDAGFSESFYLPAGEEAAGGVALNVEAPQKLYYAVSRKVVFTGEFTPGYSFVRSEDENGQFNYLARADMHLTGNHLYLDTYTSRASQLRTYAADINRLATADERETGIAGEFKYSSRTSTIFSARYRDTTHPLDKINPEVTDRPIQRLDRNETNGRVTVHHKRTFGGVTSSMLGVEVSKYRFDEAHVNDSTRRWLGVGLSRDTGRMSMRAEIGPASLDFKDPGQRDYTGIVAVFDASRSRPRWLYSLHADRDLGFSLLADSNYYVANRARLSASYAARRRVTVRGQVSVERDDFEPDSLGRRRRDTIVYPSIGVLYTLYKVQVGTDVGYLDRKSTLGGDEDSGIRWTLLLSFTP